MMTDRPIRIQSLTTPAMFIVSADVLPMSRNTAMFSAGSRRTETQPCSALEADGQKHGHVQRWKQTNRNYSRIVSPQRPPAGGHCHVGVCTSLRLEDQPSSWDMPVLHRHTGSVEKAHSSELSGQDRSTTAREGQASLWIAYASPWGMSG
jgi:hypothetical protein